MITLSYEAFTFLLSLRYDRFRGSARVDRIYSKYPKGISNSWMKTTDQSYLLVIASGFERR